MLRHSPLLFSLLCVSLIGPARAAVPDPLPEDLVLAGDWTALALHLSDVKSVDPVSNFISAHAFLATDRANEAMCRFAAGTPADARAAWRAWTSQLATAHPASAVARYLAGDALARDGEWPAARAAFDHALASAPGDPLILNARAVAEAAAGQWLEAKTDLLSAAGTRGAPADVRTNQAVLAVLHRDDPAVADGLFRQIGAKTPNHVIALIGRGAVAAADHQWEVARGYYRTAVSITACLPLALDNMLLVEQAELNEQRQITAARLASANPGTEMYKNYETATNSNFAFVRTSTFDTAKAVGALSQSGGLSNFQNPNNTMAQYALATGLRSTGAAMGAMADSVGGWMMTNAIANPKGAASAFEAVGGLATSAAGHAAQNTLSDWANKIGPMSGWTLSLPPPPPPINNVGGLRPAPPKQAWDNGDWPVALWPVLLYAVTPVAAR